MSEQTETENAPIVEQNADFQSTGMNPNQLLEKAVEGDAPVETIERLLDLQERWEKRQAKKAYDRAMSELRKDLPTIEKQRDGHNYKYESLTDVVEAIQESMYEHGLSFRWKTKSNQNEITVNCVISHELGHSEETGMTAGLDETGSKNKIQALGSAVSYLQRYTLKAAVGLAAGEDTDADISVQDSPADEINEWATEATESARDLADEAGVSLSSIHPGSGKNGRVVKSDVQERIEELKESDKNERQKQSKTVVPGSDLHKEYEKTLAENDIDSQDLADYLDDTIESTVKSTSDVPVKLAKKAINNPEGTKEAVEKWKAENPESFTADEVPF